MPNSYGRKSGESRQPTREVLHQRIARLEHALCYAEYRREQAERQLEEARTALTKSTASKVRFTEYMARQYIQHALLASEGGTDNVHEGYTRHDAA
jgi:hypothetical protein